MSRFSVVGQWAEERGLPQAAAESCQVSLDEISHMLLHHARSRDDPVRLAMVLTGGGAKCAYQVGAVAALEQALGKLRRENS